MNVDYCFVEPGQFPAVAVSNNPDTPLSFFHRDEGVESSPGVVAHVRGVMCGWLAYDVERDGVLTVHVIWVARESREQGIAANLLALLISVVKPKRLRVQVISTLGAEFFYKAKRHYPKVKFRIYGGRAVVFHNPFWEFARAVGF